MSLVDSLDSVIMAYSYAGLLERKKGFRLFERTKDYSQLDSALDAEDKLLELKNYTVSNLGITLTLMSIVVAFRYAVIITTVQILQLHRSVSMIVMMGLIGDNCGPCQRAVNDPNGGGLAGRWWRFWGAVS